MHAVTTTGLDIAKSVLQVHGNRRGRQRDHSPSAEAPLCPDVFLEGAAMPRWYRSLRIER